MANIFLDSLHPDEDFKPIWLMFNTEKKILQHFPFSIFSTFSPFLVSKIFLKYGQNLKNKNKFSI